MVTASKASIDFNWQPQIVPRDSLEEFIPSYVVSQEAVTHSVFVKTKFASLPSAGIWVDRTESDEQLLEQLGGDWRDFGTEQ